MEKDKSKNIIIIILIMVILMLICFIIYDKLIKKDTSNECPKQECNCKDNGIVITDPTDNIKKDTMLNDAKKLISLTKYQVNKRYDIRSNPPHTFTLEELNVNGDIKNDPDGGKYDTTLSTVKYYVENNTAIYCVTLIGSKRTIGLDGCIKEVELNSRSNVIDR